MGLLAPASARLLVSAALVSAAFVSAARAAPPPAPASQAEPAPRAQAIPRAPTNDGWARALAIDAAAGPWSSLGATEDGRAACDRGEAPDVWFAWTPERSSSVRVRLEPEPAFDAVLSLHALGAGGELLALACDDGAGRPGAPRELRHEARASVPVWLRVAGRDGARGRFTLALVGEAGAPPRALPPAHGARARALPIAPGLHAGFTRGLPGEPGACLHASEDAWFSYVPARTGRVSLASCGLEGTTSDASLAVEAEGELVACSSCSPQTVSAFLARAGVRYTIRVGSTGGASGAFALRLRGPPAAEGALAPAVGEGEHLLSLVGREPATGGEPRLILRHVPRADGELLVTTCASSSPAIGAYGARTSLALFEADPRTPEARPLPATSVLRRARGGLTPQPFVRASVRRGRTVWIQVGADARGALEPLRLDVELLTAAEARAPAPEASEEAR